MTERCFVKVQWDRATSIGGVRRAVGGFLRYIQHRDLHPGATPSRSAPEVAGLLKYVAYRDQANMRAELFGPHGRATSTDRKRFAQFVARSIESSRPQPFRSRDGRLLDRRRSVSRFLISPEHARGLDLEQLLRLAVARLESEMGIQDLQWIAAIHRNTAHHHVHLVLAGMHQEPGGGYHRVDITRQRLAAMKEAVGLEIERQRGPRDVQLRPDPGTAGEAKTRASSPLPALRARAPRPANVRTLPQVLEPRTVVSTHRELRSISLGSVLALRTAARRYQRQMERETAEEARHLGLQRAA